MKTPILLMTFNRPGPTARVFDEIRKIKPKNLFISTHGPRENKPDDVPKCEEVLKIVKNIDWPCDVKYLFRDKNLGCKLGCAGAITWFFNNVPEGIVLEDDCLPDPTFFRFCEEMLEYYRDHKNIAIISGHNVDGTIDTPYSYIFTRYGHLWGWASWAKVWKNYDVTMKFWLDKKNQSRIKKAIDDRTRWNYSRLMYENTFSGKKDTWDYQWESNRLLNGLISILPKENMIENLGFGPDATHTKALKSDLILSRRQTIFSLIHNPGPIIPNETYDKKLGPKMSNFNFYKHKLKKWLHI